jgi:hypothetical protein
MFHRESPEDPAKRGGKPKDVTALNTATKPPSLGSDGRTDWGIATEQHSGNPTALSPEGEGSSSEAFSSVEEVWFVGCHSDVGGGAVTDTVRYSLADITLTWMVKQVILSPCGIKFDRTALINAGIDVSTINLIAPTRPITELRPQPEAEPSSPTSPGGEDGSGEYMVRKRKKKGAKAQPQPPERDASADIHDELHIHIIWWVLEILPIKFEWQETDGTWKSRWRLNLGRGRQVRVERPNFHVSVRERMATAELNYKPKAKWVAGTEQYVD